MAENKILRGYGSLWGIGVVISLLPVAAFAVGAWWAAIAAVVIGLVLTSVMIALLKKTDGPLQAVFEEAMRKKSTAKLSSLAGEDPAARQLATLLEQGRDAESLWRSALMHLGVPLVVADATGKIVLANDAMGALLGRSSDQLTGETGNRIFSGNAAAAFDAALGGTDRNHIEINLEAKGRKISALFWANSFGPKNNRLGAVAAATDISSVQQRFEALEKLQGDLISTGSGISDLAQKVASASEELSASADELAHGSQRQRAQADSVATAMEEMTATVLEVAQNASATSEVAGEAQDAAREGVDLVERAVSGINSVSTSAAELAQVLSQLDGQAGEIGRIINVINDIADQTNLLALNAAIEAARAGEAGRGFAVVADEVRKLAEKTMTATKEVEQAIRTIQSSSHEAINSMEQTERQVQESTDLSNQAGNALQQIMSQIDDMVMRVSQIATAAEEQSAAAEEINQNVEEIAHITMEAEEGSQQSAEATRALAKLSQELLTLSLNLTGSSQDSSKLWKSSGNMRGVLPKLMQDFIKETQGKEMFDKISELMGNPVFLPTTNYPDKVLHQMASTLEDLTGEPLKKSMKAFGHYTVPHFARMYPGYIRTKDLKEFLLSIDDMHKKLTKDYPGIKPPKFSYEDKGDTLIMTYQSERGLFNYFEGILQGAADFLKGKISVSIQSLDSTRAKATIKFLK